MKITLITPFLGTSGYCSHGRSLANALYELGLDISVRTQLPPDWARFVNDNELEMIKKQHNPHDSIGIYIGLPQSNNQLLSERYKKFIQWVVWEGNKIPKGWIKHLLDERVSQIWTPSQHTKDSIENTILEYTDNIEIIKKLLNKIKIVNHGVNKTIFYPEDKIEDKLKRDEFIFVANKGWRHNLDRGGLQYLIKAYAEEFTNKDKVKLSIKINPAYGIKTPEEINALIENLNIKNKNKPVLEISQSDLTFDELRKFYNQGNIFVSTTMAESFNLPGLEAMACGLPTLQTHYGGQVDYMNKDNSYMIIKGKLVEVTWDNQYEGIKWNKPDIKEIREQLRYCYEHKEEVMKKGLCALNDSTTWIWLKTAFKVLNFLKELKE